MWKQPYCRPTLAHQAHKPHLSRPNQPRRRPRETANMWRHAKIERETRPKLAREARSPISDPLVHLLVLVNTQDQGGGAVLLFFCGRKHEVVLTWPPSTTGNIFGRHYVGFAGRLMSTERENPSGNGPAISNACVAPQFQASVLVMPQVPVTSKSMTATF